MRVRVRDESNRDVKVVRRCGGNPQTPNQSGEGIKKPLCEAGECDTVWFGEYGLRDGMWRVTHGDEFYCP